MEDIGKRAASGFLWSAILKFGQEGVRFIVQLVLARLLLPEEFGLVAMVAVFLSVSSLVAQGGLGSALVQAEDINESDIRTVFSANVVMALLMVLILWFTAPAISHFYGEEQLTPILRVMAGIVLIRQLGAVHNTLFGRDMNFKQVARTSLPGLFLSGVCGIALAYAGFGVWALVVQAIIAAAVSTMLLSYYSPWKARFGFSLDSAKRMYSFGIRVSLNQILNSVFTNIYVLVIGRYYSVVEVAYYQRAKSFQSLPVLSTFQVFNRVAFPLMSRLNSDSEKRRVGFCKLLGYLSWLVFPGMALLAAISEPMIVVLIKEKWLPAAPYLAALCCLGPVMTFNMINMIAMQAAGRADVVLKISFLDKVLTVLNIVLMMPHGILAMIYGQVVVGLVTIAINQVANARLIEMSILKQYKVVFRPVVTACVVFVVASWVGLMSLPAFSALILACLLGGVFWWLAMVASRAVFQEDLSLISKQYPAIAGVLRYSCLLKGGSS